MRQYKIGDFVRVKVHASRTPRFDLDLIETVATLPPDEKACTFYSVQIVGCHQMTNHDYIALCDFDPHSYMSFKIDSWHVKAYDVPDKFNGNKGMFIHTRHVWVPQIKSPTKQIRSSTPGGSHCKLCKKFIQYANANRDDGTFACRRCIQSTPWLLKCKPLDD